MSKERGKEGVCVHVPERERGKEKEKLGLKERELCFSERKGKNKGPLVNLTGARKAEKIFFFLLELLGVRIKREGRGVIKSPI